MASRKVSRKSNKKASRKSNKKASRKQAKRMSGGMAALNDASMLLAQKASLAQGSQYLNLHKGQFGGMAPYPGSVEASSLPSDLVASARTGALDAAIAATRGMQDGGRRSSKRFSLKKRKNLSKRGGAFSGSPLSANSMLLPAGLEKQAALNSEWSLAKNPSSFAPNP